MSAPTASVSAREVVHRVSELLDAAATVARAAEACARSGDSARALAILPDIEPTPYEVTTLLNAVSILCGNCGAKIVEQAE
jgi:hypothetical protein